VTLKALEAARRLLNLTPTGGGVATVTTMTTV
jgi:hypothetical protein